MKSDRHQAIIDIIGSFDIETQDELIHHLKDVGFSVTQATVSRDIRELKLTKSLSRSGKYIYYRHHDDTGSDPSVYGDAMSKSLKSVNFAGNIVVIKTYPGLANAVAVGIDSQNSDEVLGSVAGDDTIIVVAKTAGVAEELCRRIADSAGL